MENIFPGGRTYRKAEEDARERYNIYKRLSDMK